MDVQPEPLKKPNNTDTYKSINGQIIVIDCSTQFIDNEQVVMILRMISVLKNINIGVIKSLKEIVKYMGVRNISSLRKEELLTLIKEKGPNFFQKVKIIIKPIIALENIDNIKLMLLYDINITFSEQNQYFRYFENFISKNPDYSIQIPRDFVIFRRLNVIKVFQQHLNLSLAQIDEIADNKYIQDMNCDFQNTIHKSLQRSPLCFYIVLTQTKYDQNQLKYSFLSQQYDANILMNKKINSQDSDLSHLVNIDTVFISGNGDVIYASEYFKDKGLVINSAKSILYKNQWISVCICMYNENFQTYGYFIDLFCKRKAIKFISPQQQFVIGFLRSAIIVCCQQNLDTVNIVEILTKINSPDQKNQLTFKNLQEVCKNKQNSALKIFSEVLGLLQQNESEYTVNGILQEPMEDISQQITKISLFDPLLLLPLTKCYRTDCCLHTQTLGHNSFQQVMQANAYQFNFQNTNQKPKLQCQFCNKIGNKVVKDILFENLIQYLKIKHPNQIVKSVDIADDFFHVNNVECIQNDDEQSEKWFGDEEINQPQKLTLKKEYITVDISDSSDHQIVSFSDSDSHQIQPIIQNIVQNNSLPQKENLNIIIYQSAEFQDMCVNGYNNQLANKQ